MPYDRYGRSVNSEFSIPVPADEDEVLVALLAEEDPEVRPPEGPFFDSLREWRIWKRTQQRKS